MKCYQCGNEERMKLEIMMDDGAEWEEWTCMDCEYVMRENYHEPWVELE